MVITQYKQKVWLFFLKNLCKKGPNISKKMVKKFLKKPRRALNFAANIASAAASKNLKASLSTITDLNFFSITGKSLYLGKFV